MKQVKRSWLGIIVSRNRRYSWIRKIQQEYTFVSSKISKDRFDNGWIKYLGNRVQIWNKVHSLFMFHILAILQVHQKWGYSKNLMDLAPTNFSLDSSADIPAISSYLLSVLLCVVKIWKILCTFKEFRLCLTYPLSRTIIGFCSLWHWSWR